ncbi:MAG TPA: zf-TFIIB domain-containing protein [Planctomycetota bacterium]|nr:zf-TFIIB domain-containing protein [Planctomycetota bacterium]
MEEVACPGCGASVPPTGICRFCNGTAFVDGVPGRLLASDLKCPRCPGGAPLQGVEHEGLRADVCASCHGAWFGAGMLEEAVRLAAERPAKKGEGGLGRALGGSEKVRYASCPRCGLGMARIPLARKPLVIIDRCLPHGHWCDAGELGQLKTIARTRGVAEALGGGAVPEGAKIATLAEDDPLLAELMRRPGNWGLVPPEVSEIDAMRHGGSALFWGRRRSKTRGLLDILWVLLR